MAAANLECLDERALYESPSSKAPDAWSYAELFEEAPVAYHEIDRHGVVVRVNRAECVLLGISAHEMVGLPVWEMVEEDDREPCRERVRAKLDGDDPLPVSERTYRRRDGSTVVCELHENRIRNGAGKTIGIRTCLLDITERKRSEVTLRKQAAELARSNAELEQFAYVASHDLQEPLRKIQAFGDRLKTRCSEALPPEGRDYLERMQNAAGRMQTLINDLLSYSRVATNAKPLMQVDLAEVAQQVISDLESRIEELHAKVAFGDLPIVNADRLQMSQLLQNLIANALKFHKPETPPEVTIGATLERECDGTGEEVWRITVEDNGIGFDDKYADRIFQLFQRLHGRNEYEGTGIGLAICRKIVRRHGGSISAYSTPGVGSRFVVTLPNRQEGVEA